MTRDNQDLVGKIFGKLLVISYYGSNSRKKSLWVCKCECGEEKVILGNSLTTNNTKSCGCLHRKGTKNISGNYWSSKNKNAIRRGLEFSITPEHAQKILESQNFKCALSGLPICIETVNTRNSKTRDRKLDTASLDRIDSSKGYTPENIQWVHKDVNFMKQKFEEKYFYDMCKKIVNNLKEKYESKDKEDKS